MQIDHISHYFTGAGVSIKNAQPVSASPTSFDNLMAQPDFRNRQIKYTQQHFETSLRRLNMAVMRYENFEESISTRIARHESGSDSLTVLMRMAETAEDKAYYEHLKENQDREYSSWIAAQNKMDDPDYKFDFLDSNGFFEDISQYFPNKTPDDIKQLYKDGADFRELFNPTEVLDASNGVFMPVFHSTYKLFPS